ncbi:MAG: PASTA domain-containing protein [Bacteroidetes bacterium]|nr:MAG: PASTA domain-containing protein [Bacteroidota bacterium]
MKEIKKDILLRVYVVYFGILLFGMAIIGKAIYIRSTEGKELLEKARKQEMRFFPIDAIRGNICADDGTLLATSIPIFDIRMDVSSDLITDDLFKTKVDSLAYHLTKLFKDKNLSEYKNFLWEGRRNGDRYLMIHRDVTYPELRQMRKFPILKLGTYKGGMIVIPQFQRELPFKNLARRTIGYENTEAAQKVYVGLEGSFSKNLQGTGGKRLMRRIGNATWMPVDIENEVEPQNGDDIITTLDINLQDLAESALRKELSADSADHGCVIVMEVKTGFIKAIINLGKSPKGGYEEVFNYAIGESSEPGSTFKLASFLVGLEDGKITMDQPINLGNGIMNYHGRSMTDAHKLTGTLLAHQVFEKSSNVGTSKLIYNAYVDEPQKYIDGLYRMSINLPQNLQIGGEGMPYIKNTKSKWWSAVSLPWMAIGYEVAITPLQTLTLYNAVANNGVMVKPLFVREIRKNGQVVQSFEPVVINPHICSPATIEKAQMLLEGVVERGTGTALKNPHYRVAGKTGTAQVAMNNKGYGQGTKAIKYKGSFVGYFPANHPRYSIIVVINNPSKGKYYGGAVAAPVFKEIADRIFANLHDVNNPPPQDTSGHLIPSANTGVQKDLEEAYAWLNIKAKPVNPAAQWAIPVSNNSSVILMPSNHYQGTMPDVTGMGVKDAVFLLEQMGLKVVLNGKGNVIRQSLSPGRMYLKGSTVLLDLAMGKG